MAGEISGQRIAPPGAESRSEIVDHSTTDASGELFFDTLKCCERSRDVRSSRRGQLDNLRPAISRIASERHEPEVREFGNRLVYGLPGHADASRQFCLARSVEIERCEQHGMGVGELRMTFCGEKSAQTLVQPAESFEEETSEVLLRHGSYSKAT